MKTKTKLMLAFVGILSAALLTALAIMLTMASSPTAKPSAQDEQGIKHAVETYLKVMHKATVWPAGYEHLKVLPADFKSARREDVYRALSTSRRVGSRTIRLELSTSSLGQRRMAKRQLTAMQRFYLGIPSA